MNGTGGENTMTVIGALASFRELGEMSPHKRAAVTDQSMARSRLERSRPRGRRFA